MLTVSEPPIENKNEPLNIDHNGFKEIITSIGNTDTILDNFFNFGISFGWCIT
jgi:hypothetical protein